MRDKTLGLMFALVLMAGCYGGKKGGSTSSGSSQQAKECAELAKDDCEKVDQIAGKTCVFMAKSCVEKTVKLASFMAADRRFSSEWTEGVSVWGSKHGRQPVWNKMFHRDMKPNTWVVFKFHKDSDDMSLGWNGGSYAKLKYSATTLEDGAFLIKIDNAGQTIMASLNPVDPNKDMFNQLDFFTKGSWFLAPDQDKIKGAMLVDYVGNDNKPPIEFKTYKDMEEGIGYMKSHPSDDGNVYDIAVHGKTAGAIAFVFSKAW